VIPVDLAQLFLASFIDFVKMIGDEIRLLFTIPAIWTFANMLLLGVLRTPADQLLCCFLIASGDDRFL
jgi:hypothetical protein